MAFCCGSILGSAETLLFSDNFNAPDTGNFDGAPLEGRRGGTLGTTHRLAASLIQQAISGNRLRMIKAGNSDGRIRFQDVESGAWLDWAAGATGTSILEDGGLQIAFDWYASDSTSTDWIALTVGGDATEPPTRVNHGATDYGILLRNNGGSNQWINGVLEPDETSFTPTEGGVLRYVTLDLSFTSFADGSSVDVTTKVNGAMVATDSFTWNSNAGVLYMELSTGLTGELIDNFKVSTKPAFAITIDGNEFFSGNTQGTPVGTLTAAVPGGEDEDSTFTFVSGEGATDNNLFQIVGSELQLGNYDFTVDTPQISSYSVRVRAESNSTSSTGERVIEIVMKDDDDLDSLPDSWEYSWTVDDLTLLDGENFADYDSDNLTDLDEYFLSLGEYPGLNPLSNDTDGDELFDDEELAGVGLRGSTDPTKFDTDGDGLSDLVETATWEYIDENDTGTDPLYADSDGDGSRDGFEVEKGSDPFEFLDRPELPESIMVGLLTDDLSTGISSSKTYTHAISGGAEATVNDVLFSPLTIASTPANFSWELISSGVKGNLVDGVGGWDASSGGVTGSGLISVLSSFTFPTGKTPLGQQVYRLTGLTPGASYEFRLLMRTFSTGGTGRPIDLIFNNGSEVVRPFGALMEDRPDVVIPDSSPNAAFYVSYNYVAEGSELEVIAELPLTENENDDTTGGYHMYGLTNELVGAAPVSNLKITSVSRNGSGELVIQFVGDPSTSYQVTKSTDLNAFGPLTSPLPAITDSFGMGSVVIPGSESTESSEFYRIED